MNTHVIEVSFDDVSPAQANRYAAELNNFLQDLDQRMSVEFKKEESNTQDFGTSLILILGTPAVLAVAKGIADWIRKRNSAKISIKLSNGTIIKGDGLSSTHVKDLILEQLQQEEN